MANLIGDGVQLAATGGTSPFAWADLGLGALETIGGLTGLSKAPEYKSEPIDPAIKAMVSRAQEMSKQGFSPEQISQFYNAQAEQNTARFRHGVDSAGGNLAGAINASNNAFNTDALNKFAVGNEQAKERHQIYADQTLKYLQGLEDKSWVQDNNHINALSQSYGGALKSGLSTLTGTLGALGLPKTGVNDPNNPNSLQYKTTAANDQNNVNSFVDNTANAWQTQNNMESQPYIKTDNGYDESFGTPFAR